MKRILFVILLVAIPVFAQEGEQGFPPRPPHQGQGQGQGGGLRERVKELGLTEQQRGKLKELRNKSSLAEKRKTWMSERQLLNEMLRNKSTEKPTIQKQLEVLNRAQAELNKERVEKLIQLRDVLTDEQREKLQSMRKERMNSGGSMMNRGGGPFQRMQQGGMQQRGDMQGGMQGGMRNGMQRGMQQGRRPGGFSNENGPSSQGESDIGEDDLEF